MNHFMKVVYVQKVNSKVDDGALWHPAMAIARTVQTIAIHRSIVPLIPIDCNSLLWDTLSKAVF